MHLAEPTQPLGATHMQTCFPRLWLSSKQPIAAYLAIFSSLAMGTISCTHRPAPTPPQSQAPPAAQTQVATNTPTQARLGANCGGQNQPPCGPPDCGGLHDDCCQPG